MNGVESHPIARPASSDLEARMLRAQVAASLFGNVSGKITIGQYEVLELVGAGGMGVVYAAWDPSLERRVAIKLLRAEAAPSGRERTRLVREALALAKVSHPNVVGVHEVGEYDEGVYLVMELVDGVSLQVWQERQERSWVETLEVYLQAGRGLAAAHAAGLVHRDFKPANVLVGKDGRVCVADFGLAQGPALSSSRTDGVRRADGERSHRVTRTGAMVGTPAYMAPEQLLDGRADARTDQFSYCVALCEALLGPRPYTVDELCGEIEAAPLLPRGRIPGWLRAALRRGLSWDSDRRWPSMNSLLEALTLRRDTRTMPWILAVSAVGVLVAVALTRDDDELCALPVDAPSRVWSEANREAVHKAFSASGKPFAEDSWHLVDRDLQAYGNAWADAFGASCHAREATRVDDAKAARIEACLGRRARQFELVAHAFAEIDERRVLRTEQVLSVLDPVESCMDDGLVSRPAAPSDEPSADVMARIDHIRTLGAVGALAEASGAMGLLLASPVLAEDWAGRAEALVVYGRLLRQQGEGTPAKDALLQAVRYGISASRKSTTADALRELVELSVVNFEDLEQAELWSVLQAGAVDGLGQPLHRAAYLDALGLLASLRGEHREAARYHEEALELLVAMLDDEGHPEITKVMNRRANALLNAGEFGQAQAIYREVITRRVQRLGEHHPDVAAVRFNLGMAALAAGDEGTALAEIGRAHAIETEAFGEDAVETATTATMLGNLLLNRGDAQRALELAERAWEVQRAKRVRPHSDRIAALTLLAIAELELGRHSSSLAHHLALVDEFPPNDAIDPGISHNIAWLSCQIEGCRDARVWLDRARAGVESDSLLALYVENTMGLIELKEGAPAAALARFEFVMREAPKFGKEAHKVLEASEHNAEQARRSL